MTRLFVALCFLFLSFAAVSHGAKSNPSQWNRVLIWNDALLSVFRATNAWFWVGFEHHAIMNIAIKEALDDLGCKNPSPSRCTENEANLTVSFAAQYALKAVYQDNWMQWENLLRAHVHAEPDLNVRDKAKRIGERSAARAVKDVLSRGGASWVDYQFAFGVEGRYQPTPPFFTPPVIQQYAFVDTFIVPATRYIAAPYPDISSQLFLDSVNEVKVMGDVNSQTRTPYQTFLARYMDGVLSKGNPEGVIGTFTRTAQEIVVQTNKGLYDTAAIMWIISISMYDVFAATMNSKLLYDKWRPITPIRQGAPSNPGLIPDPNWTPLLLYNSNQEYPAGHAAVSGCADLLFKRVFGRDDFTYTLPTYNADFGDLTFNSFTQMKTEGSEARIWAGIHFRFSLYASWDLAGNVCGDVYDQLCRNNRCFVGN